MPIASRASNPSESVNGSKNEPLIETSKAQALYQSRTKFMPVYFDEEGRYFLKPDPNKPIPKGTQEYYRLRKECLDKGVLFEDPLFPAADSSIHIANKPCESHYTWLRPKEIDPDAIFSKEGYSRFAVRQGSLGDCWMVAAAANLTIFPELFRRVVPDDNDAILGGQEGVDYAGIFHFRFWRYGQWYDVVIDDRLPTQNGQLVNTQPSLDNEFFAPLLEKAYAKLFGTYEALIGGLTVEALVDFTGGLTEMHSNVKQTSVDLFEIIQQGCRAYAMFACSIDRDPNEKGDKEGKGPLGLRTGHAYSITDAQVVNVKSPQFQGKVKLLRIRNPWGDSEWVGPWSDKSSEWKYVDEATKRLLGVKFDDDGEFWISYDDFKKYFDDVEMCHLTPDSPIVKNSVDCFKWNASFFEGEWVKGNTAGGCRNNMETFARNPQYRFKIASADDVQDKSTVIIELTQKNVRTKENKGIVCKPISFIVYDIPESEIQQKPFDTNFFYTRNPVVESQCRPIRETSTRLKLTPGNYVVVPSTFYQNQEGEFILRVFSETANSMEEIDSPIDISDPEDVDADYSGNEASQYEDLFYEVAGEDGEVDWMELKMLLESCFKEDIVKSAEAVKKAYQSGDKSSIKREQMLEQTYLSNSGFSKDACRSMVAMLDEDGSGKLGVTEFQKLLTNIFAWKAVFKKYDADGNGYLSPFELRSALESAGFTLNNRIINKLMHRYSSKDGQIWFDDFITCAVKIRTMFDKFNTLNKGNKKQISFGLDEWISQTIYT